MPTDVSRHTFTRRDLLRYALAAGGVLLAGGAGGRAVRNAVRRDFDAARTGALLDRVEPADSAQLPNIVLISADDLGYGDLGCYGAQAIRTPNVDRIAREGALMTQAYAAAPLCSPSRASLMTGRYPVRTLVTMPLYPAASFMDLVFNVGGVYPYGVRGIPQDEALLPELLQRRGYRTALLGKWHLGDTAPHRPTENGFDAFLGAYFSNDMEPYAIFRDDELAIPPPVDQSQLTPLLTREAVAFITANRERPFFLYYAQPFPHVPLHASEAFRGRSEAGLYGDCVEELDWSVGQILETLRDLDLDERTLVVFTSDNGPWWEGSPGGMRGRKNLPFEGGFRMPLVARWPGVIPPGVVSDAVSMNFDLFATCLGIAGVSLPGDRIVDGLDLLPVFKGESCEGHETLFYYKGNRLLGVRRGDWKYLRRHMTDNGGYASLHQGPFLFNLARDPDESYDLSASEPDVARRLAMLLDEQDAIVRANVRGWL
ncbi:MAG: sulfatase [Anaerolineae bacterium]|nr:sulfatase [Anaerolineae bacterium]